MAWEDFSLEREYSPDTAIDKWRPKWHVHGKILDYLKSCTYAYVARTNKEGADFLAGYEITVLGT